MLKLLYKTDVKDMLRLCKFFVKIFWMVIYDEKRKFGELKRVIFAAKKSYLRQAGEFLFFL